jgi:hypothetical protein
MLWGYTGSGTTQALGLHRLWDYTGSGATQTLGLHRLWGYTGYSEFTEVKVAKE